VRFARNDKRKKGVRFRNDKGKKEACASLEMTKGKREFVSLEMIRGNGAGVKKTSSVFEEVSVLFECSE